MSYTRIGRALRKQIGVRDRHRCCYCLTPEAITGAPMELDHIVPESLGGPSTAENLCLACAVCNSHKARLGKITALSGTPPALDLRAETHSGRQFHIELQVRPDFAYPERALY